MPSSVDELVRHYEEAWRAYLAATAPLHAEYLATGDADAYARALQPHDEHCKAICDRIRPRLH